MLFLQYNLEQSNLKISTAADDEKCDKCISDSTEFKAKIVPGYIKDFIDDKTKRCGAIDYESFKDKCSSDFGVKVYELEYLSINTPIEFCQWPGKCPKNDSAKLLGCSMFNLKRSFARWC